MDSFDTNINPLDELDAINDVLAAIGESPVATLEGAENVDVANARRILTRVNRAVQSKGWTFNIEEGVTLLPDTSSNMVPYGSDILSLLGSGGQTQYVNRNGFVYDRVSQTDEFPGGVTVNLIRLRSFSEMPECFRNLIVSRSARQFNARFFGSQEVEQMLAGEEYDAQIVCFEYELDYGKYNMLDGDAFVQGIISR